MWFAYELDILLATNTMIHVLLLQQQFIPREISKYLGLAMYSENYFIQSLSLIKGLFINHKYSLYSKRKLKKKLKTMA